VAYHALIGGEQQGPFERDTLAGMVARGEVTTDTLVWASGMTAWAPAATVDDLSGLFENREAGRSASAPPTAPRRVRQRLAMGRALGDGLAVIARQPLRLIGVIVLYTLVGLAVTAPMFAVMVIGALSVADGDGIDTTSHATIVWIVLGYLVVLVVTSGLYGGVCAVMLDAVRGTRIRFARLFAGFKRIVPLFLFMLIVFLMTGIALVPMGVEMLGALALLSFLPALFLAVTLLLGPFYIIDAGAGPIRAVAGSFGAVMRLGWFRVFGTLLVLVVLAIALLLVVALVMGLSTMAVFGGGVVGPDDVILPARSLLAMVPQVLISYGLLVLSVGVFAAIYEQAGAG
jgi:hypothetical protein